MNDNDNEFLNKFKNQIIKKKNEEKNNENNLNIENGRNNRNFYKKNNTEIIKSNNNNNKNSLNKFITKKTKEENEEDSLDQYTLNEENDETTNNNNENNNKIDNNNNNNNNKISNLNSNNTKIVDIINDKNIIMSKPETFNKLSEERNSGNKQKMLNQIQLLNSIEKKNQENQQQQRRYFYKDKNRKDFKGYTTTKTSKPNNNNNNINENNNNNNNNKIESNFSSIASMPSFNYNYNNNNENIKSSSLSNNNIDISNNLIQEPRKSVRDILKLNEDRIRDLTKEHDDYEKRNSIYAQNRENWRLKMQKLRDFIKAEKEEGQSNIEFYQENFEYLKDFGITNIKDFESAENMLLLLDKEDENLYKKKSSNLSISKNNQIEIENKNNNDFIIENKDDIYFKNNKNKNFNLITKISKDKNTQIQIPSQKKSFQISNNNNYYIKNTPYQNNYNNNLLSKENNSSISYLKNSKKNSSLLLSNFNINYNFKQNKNKNLNYEPEIEINILHPSKNEKYLDENYPLHISKNNLNYNMKTQKVRYRISHPDIAPLFKNQTKKIRYKNIDLTQCKKVNNFSIICNRDDKYQIDKKISNLNIEGNNNIFSPIQTKFSENNLTMNDFDLNNLNNSNNKLKSNNNKNNFENEHLPTFQNNNNNNNNFTNKTTNNNNNYTTTTNTNNNNYKENIIKALDSIAIKRYEIDDSRIPLDPSFLDILCINCYESVKYKDMDKHSEICVIHKDEYKDNAYDDDYNTRIFKLHESLKNKKKEIVLKNNKNLSNFYENLSKLVYDILINNNSIEELKKNIIDISDIINNQLDKLDLSENYKFYFLLFCERLSQLVKMKLEDMEKIYMNNNNKNNDNNNYEKDSLDDEFEENEEDFKDDERIKYMKQQLTNLDNKTKEKELELNQWKKEAKILENNLRKNNSIINNRNNRNDISEINSEINSKNENSDVLTTFTGQMSEFDFDINYGANEDFENEEDRKKYFLSVGLNLKFKYSEQINDNLSIADLYEKSKELKIQPQNYQDFLIKELNIKI